MTFSFASTATARMPIDSSTPRSGAIPSSQDAGFLTELTLGTCRWQLWLDAQLRPFLNRPIKNTTRGVRWALRLGAYEILKMRTPSHAAVDEAVQLIRDKRQRGFVNASCEKCSRSMSL